VAETGVYQCGQCFDYKTCSYSDLHIRLFTKSIKK
jgi:hypothetical protein